MGQEVKKWMEKAEHDFITSKVNFQQRIYDASAFFIQQSIEKALKAAYIQNFGELIRTHDLVYLGKKINLPDDLLEICDEINSFYIETRYPDTYTEFDEEYIEEIMNKAENVLKWMRAHIL